MTLIREALILINAKCKVMEFDHESIEFNERGTFVEFSVRVAVLSQLIRMKEISSMDKVIFKVKVPSMPSAEVSIVGKNDASHVPYQLCPKCNGEGYIANAKFDCTGHADFSCDICNGAKIIPMHVIKE